MARWLLLAEELAELQCNPFPFDDSHLSDLIHKGAHVIRSQVDLYYIQIQLIARVYFQMDFKILKN